MNLNIELSGRFSAVMLNGELVAGTNYKKILSDVNWQESEHKIASLNTIAGLTFHLNYYISGVLQVLQGGELSIRDKYSYDCKKIENESDWTQRCEKLFTNAQQFAQMIQNLTKKQLEEDFVNPKYGTYKQNIELMIEHCYYHLGQMVLIKKLIRQ